ncbi:MAG: polysaccharide biosynthesis/export family protein, partial [Bacteroidaceae bacterium]|nr:polysaccharide biosynthesis/export family protein [Bacteroidaceae bacterium]
MSMGKGCVMGLALGTSEAVGYVNCDGKLLGWFNELAFAPVDLSSYAMQDEWSTDFGVGCNYFSQDAVMGTAGQGSSTNISSSGSMTNVYGYTVSNDGYVTLPAVGRVSVAGLTSDEAADRIEKTIIDANLIKDPDVTVRLLNARVAVLGAVNAPQVVNLTSERNTILDVLSRCGDVADTGLRQKVTLYREENGERKKYSLDLTSADIFQSPAYYVQQNDLIYVEPNKSQKVKSSAFYTFLGAGSAILGVISAIVTIVMVTTR